MSDDLPFDPNEYIRRCMDLRQRDIEKMAKEMSDAGGGWLFVGDPKLNSESGKIETQIAKYGPSDKQPLTPPGMDGVLYKVLSAEELAEKAKEKEACPE